MNPTHATACSFIVYALLPIGLRQYLAGFANLTHACNEWAHRLSFRSGEIQDSVVSVPTWGS